MITIIVIIVIVTIILHLMGKKSHNPLRDNSRDTLFGERVKQAVHYQGGTISRNYMRYIRM